MKELAALEGWFRPLDRAILGFSGGVDSAVVAVVGASVLGPDRFLAVIGRSASYPAVQWIAARALAREFSIPVREIETDELDDPSYRVNNPDRCYYCKRELWGKLATVAAEFGADLVLDGTNVDDLGGHRPGRPAGREAGVRSPLVELGWTKATVRSAAGALGLPIWNAPASPCLSSRIQYGLEVTPGRLEQVERAEAFLRGLGVVGDLRVRHLGRTARIEVGPAMFGLVDAASDVVARRFREIGFDAVTRDPDGYRRGSLLPLLGGAG